MELTKQEALRAYARMLNTLSVGALEPYLADDFVYESQMVLTALRSKQEFLEYIRPKLETIRTSGATLFAEMGEVWAYFEHQPCVVLAQGNKQDLIGIVLATIARNKLSRLDLCAGLPRCTLGALPQDGPGPASRCAGVGAWAHSGGDH